MPGKGGEEVVEEEDIMEGIDIEALLNELQREKDCAWSGGTKEAGNRACPGGIGEEEKKEEKEKVAVTGANELYSQFAFANIQITEVVEERQTVKKAKKGPRSSTERVEGTRGKRVTRPVGSKRKLGRKTMKPSRDDFPSPTLHSGLGETGLGGTGLGGTELGGTGLGGVELGRGGWGEPETNGEEESSDSDKEEKARLEAEAIDALTQYEGAGLQHLDEEVGVLFAVSLGKQTVIIPLQAAVKPGGTKGVLWNMQYICGLLMARCIDTEAFPPKWHEFVFARADTGEEIGWDEDFVVLPPPEDEDPLIIVAVYRLTLDGFKAGYSMPISRELQREISSLPQHDPNGEANEKWLASRVGRLTGSVAGDIYGVNPWSSPDKRLKEYLWRKFKGNAATRYGNENEDNCEASVEDWMLARLLHEPLDSLGFKLEDVRFEHKGLCVCRAKPILAMSPDGFLIEDWFKECSYSSVEEAEEAWRQGPQHVQPDCPRPIPIERRVETDEETGEIHVRLSYTLKILLEYKCPFKKRFYTSWNEDEPDLYPAKLIAKTNLIGSVPSYYYSQLHHGAHSLGVLDDMLTYPTHMWLGVWAPSYEHGIEWPNFRTQVSGAGKSATVATQYGTAQITKVPFDPAYALDLEKFETRYWHDRLMPAMWMKKNGMLEEGKVPSYRETLGMYGKMATVNRSTRGTTRGKGKQPVKSVPAATEKRKRTPQLQNGSGKGNQTFMNEFIVVEDVGKLIRAPSGNLDVDSGDGDSDIDDFGDDFACVS